MKLKKWLILSHLAVMLTPIILALILFVIINSYNKNTQVMNYISTMSKFKAYEKVLDDPNIYDGSSLTNKKFVMDEDKSSVAIEVYNAVGQQIYSSDDNMLGYIDKSEIYSDLYKIQTGTKANTLKMPVFKDSKLVGFYKIVMTRDDFIQAVNYRTVLVILCFIFMVLAVFTLVVILLNKKFNKPIKLLIEGMNKFAVGDEVNLNYKCGDEIGELINHFNNMKNDIEEKRKTIELQQKSKEYMISAISHDLKTPLTAIRAYAESMECEEDLGMEDLKNKVSIILHKSDYMKNMIDDLMMYNLLTTDYKMKFVELEGSELFEMLFSGYDKPCEKKKIKLTSNIEVNGKYNVDVRQMTRVIDNLMANALRYTKEGGAIYMGAFSPDEELPNWLEINSQNEIRSWRERSLLILIKNEGSGIKDKEKEKVFMPFYQSDDSRSKNMWKGVGLGLSIVQLVIQKHGGEVKVFSEESSTVFICAIPMIKN
ncbi:HAMP domain-containing sensor histidine kinase [Clostridium ljungdahlii]|uniref:histidine kinase n=1 Tax=Clostridium ljungdahlii TaxID=1538 RepID=A0A168LPQ8_9CLOT|nr:HAMP domain-containing sensor histidine kinase [Clostridium ljungdahlii]OAA83521.1 Alkaline phosphatase synthesis sensor protein PhoR [Clostridium ljungdahlii]